MMRRQRYFPAPVLALALWLGAFGAAGTGCGSSESPGTGEPQLEVLAEPGESDLRGVVLFLGDSLSAGAGLRADQTFPAEVQRRIDAEALPFRVVNAGVSGDTTAGGLRRIDWLLKQPVDTLVIQLGGNDMLRGQDLVAMRSNLRQIAEKTRRKYPDAALIVSGMRATPNLGEAYASQYETSFEELARELGAAYIPFLLDGVAAVPRLNQPDGIHPTAEGHQIVAETVWRVLGPVLRSRSAGSGA